MNEDKNEPTTTAKVFENMMPDDVLVKSQQTPNPNAIKFVSNYPFKSSGKATFQSSDDPMGLVMLESLFEMNQITQIHFFQNTLTVTHDGSVEEETFIKNVESVIKTRFPVHNPEFEKQESAHKAKINRDGLSEEMKIIEEILDRTIRPGLQADGGDLDVISFEDDVIKILYQGACGGCPSAMMGTLDAIQNILRFELKNQDLVVRPL